MRPNDFGLPSCAAAQPVAENLPASEIIARETVEDLTAALTESGAVAAGLEAAVNAS
jgi:hypothetical protein